MATQSEATSKDEHIQLEWVAPARPFQPRSREFYRTALALIFLIVVVLFFIREFLLIGGVIATFFVFYVLSTVPPEKIRHRITKLGIETGNYFHRWEEFHEFWFDERYGQPMLVVRTLLGFPTHLQLLLDDVNKEKVKRLLLDKIPFKDRVEKTFLDRASEWLTKNIPLEKASS